jgi:hypothetical protein
VKTEDKIARVQEIVHKLEEKEGSLVYAGLLDPGDMYVIREVLYSQLKRWQNQQRAYDYHKQQRAREKRAMNPEAVLKVGARSDGTFLTGQLRHNVKLGPGVEPPDPNRPVSRGGNRLGELDGPDPAMP